MSIVVFGFVYMAFSAITSVLGLPTYLDFGETINVMRGAGRYSYDESISGEITDVGFYIIVMSAMISWRCYHMLLSGKMNGGLSPYSATKWFYFIVGASAYIIITTSSLFIMEPGLVQRVVGLGAGGFAVWLTYQKYINARTVLWSNDIKSSSKEP